MATKRTSALDDIKDEIMCSICLKIFTDPQILSCLHTFCQHCVKDISGSSKIVSCPTCQATTDMTDIKSDFRISRFIEKYYRWADGQERPSNSCELCDENPAIYKCLRCNRLTCQTCRKAHVKMSDCHDKDSVTLESFTKKQKEELKVWKKKLEKQASTEQKSYKKDMKKMEDQRQEALKIIGKQENEALQHFRNERQKVNSNIKKNTKEQRQEKITNIDKEENDALIHFRNERQKVNSNIDETKTIRTTEHDEYQKQIQERINYINTKEQADNTAYPLFEPIIDELKKELGQLHLTSFSFTEMTIHNREFHKEKEIEVSFTKRKQLNSYITDELTFNHNVITQNNLSIKQKVHLPCWVGKMLVYHNDLLCLMEKSVEVFNPSTGQHKRTLTTGLRKAWSMAITTKQQLLIASGWQGLLLYEFGGGRIQCINKEPHWDVTCVGDCIVALRVKDGLIHIDEYDNKLQKLNHSATPVQADRYRYTCAGISGTLYIGSTGHNCVYHVDINTGTILHIDGCKGSLEPGQLNSPYLCAINNQVLLIADYYNHRVQTLDCETSRWKVLDIQGLKHPAAAAIDGDGRLLIAGGECEPDTLYIVH